MIDTTSAFFVPAALIAFAILAAVVLGTVIVVRLAVACAVEMLSEAFSTRPTPVKPLPRRYIHTSWR